MIILLDSGILLRLVDRADPLHSSVRASVRALKVRGNRLVMAPQNVAEFWNVCTRPATARGGLGLSIGETETRLRLLERIIRLLPDTPVAYSIWRSLVVSLGISGVQVHDARLAALMYSHGVTHLLTLNTPDFQRYAGITAMDPHTAISANS